MAQSRCRREQQKGETSQADEDGCDRACYRSKSRCVYETRPLGHWGGSFVGCDGAVLAGWAGCRLTFGAVTAKSVCGVVCER